MRKHCTGCALIFFLGCAATSLSISTAGLLMASFRRGSMKTRTTTRLLPTPATESQADYSKAGYAFSLDWRKYHVTPLPFPNCNEGEGGSFALPTARAATS